MDISIPLHLGKTIILRALPLSLRRGYFLLSLALACLAFSPNVRAQFENTFYGANAGYFNSTGDRNSGFGEQALVGNKGGSDNVAIGLGALANNQTSQNTAVGSQALLSSTSGSGNTATGFLSLYRNNSGYNNVANGWQTLYSNTLGAHNSATGAEALYTNNADYNTANGSRSLYTNSTGTLNTASGYAAMYNNTSGSYNTAAGTGALNNNTSGSNNVAIGREAGAALTTGNNNIDIGASVLGAAGEANTIRIGKQGTQKKAFVSGIYSIAEPAASGIKPVYINSNGQLGTAPPASSARFKDAIKPMGKSSEAILGLKPVTFHYKSDEEGTPQYGLIAEEVAKVNPDLCVRDDEGKIYTVRYDAVNAMLLNEFLKEHRKVEAQEATMSELSKEFQAKFAQQQKQIEALTAGLQQVSAQVQLSKAAPQAVANNQ